MTVLDDLLGRLESRDATIGVVGLGYVGLPVAVSFAEAGFPVMGIDLSREKVDLIRKGKSYLRDVPTERLAPLTRPGRLKASTSFARLKDADAVLLCVPTPITEGQPDLSNVVAAGTALSKVLKPNSLVVLESTTYPGSTEELLVPLLESAGLAAGKDLLVAYSPERIDPGSSLYSFQDIPKIVGGIDETSTEVAAALYGQVVPKVVMVPGTREAELAKYAHELDIDIWEAMEAAASKPFGFMPFWPGPGWGGHCIPLDPAFLSWRVRKERSHEVRFVETAQAVNAEMPRFVADRVSLLLNEQGKSVRNAKILGLGVSYKPGVEDTRESGALKVLHRLAKQGAEVAYHDPLVESVELEGREYRSVELTPELLSGRDVVVILVGQTGIDWDTVAEAAPLVLDCCNALGRKTDSIRRL